MQARVRHFHPHRPDLINATQRLAKTLGGEVTLGKRVEPLGWKFAWIKKIFGPQFAYLAQDKLPQFKNWALGFGTGRCFKSTKRPALEIQTSRRVARDANTSAALGATLNGR